MSTKINGLNFVEQIKDLEERYKDVVKATNFLNDNRSEFRKAVEDIEDDHGIYHAFSNSMKEPEKHLLVLCYTISEQMLKAAKYELLDFDETEKTRFQKFLEYKLNPERFSPNPKCSEINKFLKRYGANKLFIGNLEIYDDMIAKRHAYAHKGDYRFDKDNIPIIKKILLYLEFEYRQFLSGSSSSWCLFWDKVNKVISSGKLQKQVEFNKLKHEIQLLIPEVIQLLRHSDPENLISGLVEVLNDLRNEEDFLVFEQRINDFKCEVQLQTAK